MNNTQVNTEGKEFLHNDYFYKSKRVEHVHSIFPNLLDRLSKIVKLNRLKVVSTKRKGDFIP